MMDLYHKTCNECSKLITTKYSTSFSTGIRVFAKPLRTPIYGIYGFVRFADEIVDTFHNFSKADLLQKFKQDTYEAIDNKISLNPVLHSFQQVVNEYHIDKEYIDAFLDSMEMDLHFDTYNDSLYKKYIYGSAEVIGLMCLRVFCKDNTQQFETLKSNAQSLGSAFQKINFLRDMKSDFEERGRTYFPGIDFSNFTCEDKKLIEADIDKDFKHGYEGILNLPEGARFGVYLAYNYYINLFDKIQKTPAMVVKEKRIRVNDSKKMFLLFSSALKNSMNMI